MIPIIKNNLKNISLDDLLFKLFIISLSVIGIDTGLKLLSILAEVNDIELNLHFIRRFDLYLTVVALIITFAINSFYLSINRYFKTIYSKYILDVSFNLKILLLLAILIYLFLLKFYFKNIYINGISILIIISFLINNSIFNSNNLKHLTTFISAISVLFILSYINYPKHLNSESNPSGEIIGQIDKYLKENIKIHTYPLSIIINGESVVMQDKEALCQFVHKGNKFDLNADCDYLAIIKKANDNYDETTAELIRSKLYKYSIIKNVQLAEDFIFNRAFIFHHYNSIQDGISLSNVSQYGYGPAALIALTSWIFNLTHLDSIFLAFNLVNLITILIVLKFNYEDKVKYLIIAAMIVSLYTTYSTSSYLAPLLYFIRYLPTIAICFFVFSFGLKSRINLLLLNSLILISIAYNKEYATFTIAAFIISAVFAKNRWLIINGIFHFILLYLFQFYFASTNDYSVLNYFSSSIPTGRGDFITSLFGVVSIFYFLFVISNLELMKNFNFNLLFFIYIFSSFKIVWIGSNNHISFLYLLLTLNICYVYLNFKINSCAKILMCLSNYFIFLFLLSTVFFINKISPKIQFDHYVSDENYSKFFSISDSILSKTKEYQKIKMPGDLLISPADSAINILTQSRNTGPYYDISTYIYSDLYLNNINSYLKNSNHSIIVDKIIFNNEVKPFIKNQGYINFYRNIEKMKFLINDLGMSYKKCGEFSYFYRLCKVP